MGLVLAGHVGEGDLPVSHVWWGESHHHVSVLGWGILLVDVDDSPVVVLDGSSSRDLLAIEVERVW